MEAETNVDSPTPGRIPTLDIIHDRFCRMFRITLSGALRRVANVNVQSTELIGYGEFLKRVPVPSSINLFGLSPLNGTAIMILETRLIFTMLDIFYGGTGEFDVEAKGRDFTPIEQRLVKRVMVSALEDLQTAWSPFYKVRISYYRAEINKLFAAIVPLNEHVMVTTLNVEIVKAPMTINIVMPYSMFQPLAFYFKAKGLLSSPFIKKITNVLDLGYKATPLPPLVKKATAKIKQNLNRSESGHVIATSGENDPENYRELSKPVPGDKSPVLGSLQHLEPEMIAKHIVNEHPQTIALILAHLIDPEKTAKVIKALPEDLRADVTYRMAILKWIPPGVMTEIEAVLEKELQSIQSNPSHDLGGIKPVAEILEAMDKKSGDTIISTIRSSNPELADSLEKSMHKKVKGTTKKAPAKKTPRKKKS